MLGYIYQGKCNNDNNSLHYWFHEYRIIEAPPNLEI